MSGTSDGSSPKIEKFNVGAVRATKSIMFDDSIKLTSGVLYLIIEDTVFEHLGEDIYVKTEIPRSFVLDEHNKDFFKRATLKPVIEASLFHTPLKNEMELRKGKCEPKRESLSDKLNIEFHSSLNVFRHKGKNLTKGDLLMVMGEKVYFSSMLFTGEFEETKIPPIFVKNNSKTPSKNGHTGIRQIFAKRGFNH